MLNFKPSGITLGVMLSATVLLSGCDGGEDRQAKYLAKAEQLFEQKNYEKAKVEVKNTLQINPNNAEARYLMGLLSEKEQNVRSAFGHFNAAIEADPNHIKSLNKVSRYYLLSKKTDLAVEKIELVLSLEPDNADALANLAIVNFSREEREKGVINAKRALEIDPGNTQAITLLTALYTTEDPDLALEILDKGIASQEDNESLKGLKVRLLLTLKDMDGAVALVKELAAEYPKKLNYLFQLSNFYLQDEGKEVGERKQLAEGVLRGLVRDNPEDDQPKLWLVEFLLKNRGLTDGQETLEQFVEESPENQSLRDSLAQIYLQTSEIEKAEALYEKVIDRGPDTTGALEARNRLIAIKLGQNQRDKAEKLLADNLKRDPENSESLIIRARLNILDGQFDEAISDLRVVLKGSPDSEQALMLLAGVHEKNRSADLALDNYQQLLSLNPKSFAGLLGAGRLLLSKGETDKALPLLEGAGTINSRHPEVARLLVGVYNDRQRWDNALSAAARLIESSETEALGHYLQGRTYLRQQNYKTAAEALEKSYRLEPKAVESLSALASSYVSQDQQDQALKLVRNHIDQYPDHNHAMELLGNLYVHGGELKSAETEFKKVIEREPGRNSAYLSLARIYAAENNPDKIEKLFRSGLESVPGNSNLRAALAELYQKQKKYDLSLSEYERLYEANPESLVIKNNLATLLSDHFNSPENLQRINSLTAELAGTESPAFLDTAGWAQYRLGNYPQAVALLSAALEYGGQGATYHYHMGMAYYRSGMNQQAKEQLELSLKDEAAAFVGKEEAISTLDLL